MNFRALDPSFGSVVRRLRPRAPGISPAVAAIPDRIELLIRPHLDIVRKALGPDVEDGILPFADFRTPAGFPSPAADFQVDRVDLQERLELDRPYVFMARISGMSMTGVGIDDGDLIVINRKLTPRHGQIVVALIDNELTCKTLYQHDGILKLVAAHPDYPDILPRDGQEWTVWGVVTSCIKSFSV